jgi:hypothetical protein
MRFNHKLAVIAGAAVMVTAANASTSLFFDGFEGGTVGNTLDTSIWNAGVSGTATAESVVYSDVNTYSIALTTTSSITRTIVPIRGTLMAYSAIPNTNGKIRNWANFATASDNTKVAVMDFYIHDAYDLSGSGNARQFIQLTDYSINNDRGLTTNSSLLQLISMGHFNSAANTNAVGLQTLGLGAVGAVPSPGVYPFSRTTLVGTGAGINAGVGAPNWVAMSYDPTLTSFRRSRGWYQLQMVYSPTEVKYFMGKVDGLGNVSSKAEVFSWTHNRAATFDHIMIPSSVSSTIPGWFDDVSVREFEIGALEANVNLGGIDGSSFDLSTVPVSLEVLDSGGNSVYGPVTVFRSNSRGTIEQVLPVSLRGTGFSVKIGSTTHLSAKFDNVTITDTGVYGIAANLVNGNADGDTEIGPGDLQAVLDAFGSGPSDPNWNPNADFDRDGEVGPGDLQIVLDNFGTEGP